MDLIFCINQLVEKYRKKKVEVVYGINWSREEWRRMIGLRGDFNMGINKESVIKNICENVRSSKYKSKEFM